MCNILNKEINLQVIEDFNFHLLSKDCKKAFFGMTGINFFEDFATISE
jgi:hypothetical protein